ncbi:MAG: hypothetical protein V1646_01525 [bacterium]
MFKKYVLIICTAFFFMIQSSGLHGMHSSVKYFPKDGVSDAALRLRTAIINSSYDYVKYLIEFCKEQKGNAFLINILSDTGTSVGRKTMLEDLFYYRPQQIGDHKEILIILVDAFKNALLSNGSSASATRQQTLLWMIFSTEGYVPSCFLNLDKCQCIDLIVIFVECLISLGGQDAINKILDTSLNGRGCTVRNLILHNLSSEYSGRLLECFAGA